jgi:aldehyde:ferredoxin oxidoreductase
MKNQPKFIYLNIGADGEVEDFKTLSEVTWCEDRVNDDDLEFISVSSILARIKELEKDVYIDSEHKKHRIKELKNLIK